MVKLCEVTSKNNDIVVEDGMNIKKVSDIDSVFKNINFLNNKFINQRVKAIDIKFFNSPLFNHLYFNNRLLAIITNDLFYSTSGKIIVIRGDRKEVYVLLDNYDVLVLKHHNDKFYYLMNIGNQTLKHIVLAD